MIVRPLAGFGAPTAIRVSVGHARGERRSSRARSAASARVVVDRARASPCARAIRSAALGSLPLANARFRLLFLATFGSGIGNWLAVIALQVDIYDRTHSGWWVGALLVATILPAVFLGVLFGPLVDRLSRKGLMIARTSCGSACSRRCRSSTDAARSSRSRPSPGSATRFFRPAVLAGLPNLVGDDELADANALLQLVEWLTTAAGAARRRRARRRCPGPDLAYWVNAATFAFSALLVRASRRGCCRASARSARGHWSDLARGFSLVRRRARCCACSSSGRS